MRVLVFNSSPQMDKGNTALVLNPFIQGMKEAGAKVEIFYTKKLTINPCQADFNCWFKTPGKCFQNDDMQMIIPKMRDTDILVLATPLYCDGVNGPMKNLMDRMVPCLHPIFELRDGHSRHPLREGFRRGELVLVSSCGLWEMDNFDPMLTHMKAFCKNVSREFAGALLRPHSASLRFMMRKGIPVNDIFEAAKDAGHQLVKDGKMSTNTLKIISRELAPIKMYIERFNQGIQQTLDAIEKK